MKVLSNSIKGDAIVRTVQHTNGLIIERHFRDGKQFTSKLPKKHKTVKALKLPLKFQPLKLGRSIHEL